MHLLISSISPNTKLGEAVSWQAGLQPHCHTQSRKVKILTFLAAFPKGTVNMPGDQVCVSVEPGGYERTSLSVLSVLLTAGYKG